MFKKPVVVLISGRAGTGKTTSAKYLQKLASKDSLISGIFPLASPIKTIAYSMGWDGLKDDRGRKLLQTLGTDVGREYDENIWCKLLFSSIEERPVYDVIFIDDWRFPGELKFVEGRFPYVPVTLRVYAPDREMLKGTENYNHISETALPEYQVGSSIGGYDQAVLNLSDIDNLYSQLDCVWSHINNNLEFYYARGEK